MGAEALARGRQPRDGLLLPALLLLHKATRQSAKWLRAGFPGPVAVNLLVTMRNDPLLTDHIAKVVFFEGLEPGGGGDRNHRNRGQVRSTHRA